jgi:hypothetical protein
MRGSAVNDVNRNRSKTKDKVLLNQLPNTRRELG